MSFYKNKGFIICILLIAISSALFWSQMRYPRLFDKTDFLQKQVTTQIYTDSLFQFYVEDSEPVIIAKKSINWMYTNWRGMAYGFVLAGLISCLLSIIQIRGSNNRFINTLVGMFLGVPQGVCANCATPIGESLRRKNLPAHTFFALVVSSPTLNMVSLSLIISMFPPYISLFYISYVIVFIALILPLVLGKDASKKISTAAQFSSQSQTPFTTWLSATQYVFKTSGFYFYNIVKNTLPFMVLAGFLGTLIVHYLPINILQVHISLENYLLYALIATLLPVPMLFDVTFAHHILLAGAPIGISLIMLFCLGSFSIYPFMHFYKNHSKSMSIKVLIAVIFTGFSIGYSCDQYILYKYHKMWDKHEEAKLQKVLGKHSNTENISSSEKIPHLTHKLQLVKNNQNYEIHSQKLKPRTQSTNQFTKIPLNEMGARYERIPPIFEDYSPSGYAVGDLNNDFFPDLVTPTFNGLAIHINTQDRTFKSYDVPIDLAGKTYHINNIVLLDLNNDGWLDILATTYLGHIFIQQNNQGQWHKSKTKLIYKLPPGPNVLTVTATDIHNDGDLDLYIGLSAGIFGSQQDLTQENIFLESLNGNFVKKSIVDEYGVTLSSLFYDFNGDSYTDLFVSNDLLTPDNLFLGNKNFEFTKIKKSDQIIPATPIFSMGIDIADFNNDLKLDILSTGIDHSNEKHPLKYCDHESPTHSHLCNDIYHLRNARQFQTKESCDKIKDSIIEAECRATFVIILAVHSNNKNLCEQLKKDPYQYYKCTFRVELNRQSKDFIPSLEDLPQRLGSALLIGKANGNFQEVARQTGYGDSYFRWNARFLDINNDSWVDIYTSTNPFMSFHNEPNLLHMNESGKRFVQKQEEYGLKETARNYNFVYADFDLDGDLDIVLRRVQGLYYYFENNVSSNNSIQISLKNLSAHRQSIGAKVYIKYAQQTRVGYVYAGGGFRSFQSTPLHFGLKDSQYIDSIKVVWPDNKSTEISGPFPANHLYEIVRK